MQVDSMIACEGKLESKSYVNTFDQRDILGQFPSHSGGGPRPTVARIWAEMEMNKLHNEHTLYL